MTDPGTRLGRMKIWTPMIQGIAVSTGENRERLISLMYRESWCTFAPGYEPQGSAAGWGDKGNAFGPFQIDKRYHQKFLEKELDYYRWCSNHAIPYNPRGQGIYACGILEAARAELRRSTPLSGTALEEGVYAAYNCGVHHVVEAVKQKLPVDWFTTGQNYSGYVFALASVLQKKYDFIWRQ